MINETKGNKRRERLRAEYRGAFGEWVLQVSRLQEEEASVPGELAGTEAEKQVESAEVAYRTVRDRLADEMIVNEAKAGVCE